MRKTELSHADLTERALDEAERQVREGGRQALSMRLIARAASCASGTLYNVIGDLDDIILHVNARTTEALADELDRAAGAHADPVACIRAMAQAYVATGGSDPKLWSLLFDYQRPEGREMPDWYRAILARPIETVHREARPAFLSDEACTDFVAQIWAALHGVVALSITDKLSILIDKPVAAFVDDLVDAHLRAAGVEVKTI
ncbi:MAG: TetR/AcrR family transcriptional regulator [Pseudomonadota bacterium]